MDSRLFCLMRAQPASMETPPCSDVSVWNLNHLKIHKMDKYIWAICSTKGFIWENVGVRHRMKQNIPWTPLALVTQWPRRDAAGLAQMCTQVGCNPLELTFTIQVTQLVWEKHKDCTLMPDPSWICTVDWSSSMQAGQSHHPGTILYVAPVWNDGTHTCLLNQATESKEILL